VIAAGCVRRVLGRAVAAAATAAVAVVALRGTNGYDLPSCPVAHAAVSMTQIIVLYCRVGCYAGQPVAAPAPDSVSI